MQRPPTFWLVAGPNGAGKTTWAMRHLLAVSGSVNFVNLDEIARGLSPLDPSVAGVDAARIALARVQDFIRERASFAMETTMSGATQLRLLHDASAGGLRTALLYFVPATPETCIARVARRVAEGGHDVPEAIIRRRFARSLANLPRYTAASDLWRVYDASGPRPRLAAEGARGAAAFIDEEVLHGAHPALRGFVGVLAGG